MVKAVSSMKSSTYVPCSEILTRVAAQCENGYTIGALTHDLGELALGVCILIFALPNIVPFPMPGVSTLTAIPMLYFSLQLMMMRKVIWLPNIIACRELKGERFRRMVEYIIPWVRRFERISRPRLEILVNRRGRAVAGFIITVLALLIALPVPFGNLVPGVAICILCLAIIEHDGVLLLLGWISTVLALVYLYGLFSFYFWAMLKTLEITTGIDISAAL